MKEFEFYQDVKMTIWGRCRFSIMAETEEEAKKIAIEHRKDDICEICDCHEDSRITFGSWDFLHDTSEDMMPFENNNEATMEIFGPKKESPLNDMIADNIH